MGMVTALALQRHPTRGAASGIGLGIATALAQAGVKVMLSDIEEAALASAVEGLKRTNADVASLGESRARECEQFLDYPCRRLSNDGV